MYEKRPVSDIQNKILNGISDIYEKAKGYFLWEITKGVAMALKDTSDRVAEDALKLDIYNLTGDELENYTYRNEGISRKPAACAVGFVRVKGKGTVNAGDLFETDGLIGFTADEACDVDGEADIAVTAREAGLKGNVPAESVINMPVTISGINECTNPEPMTGGYDAEGDSELLNRYLEYVRDPPTSGNIAHYKAWAKEVVGVSDAYIIPLWNGPNTVKVIIIDQKHLPADEELVQDVQEHIDPGISGTGEGQAPIGAFCTVAAAGAKTIDISAAIITAEGYDREKVKNSIKDILAGYFSDLAFRQYYISYAKIGAMILEAEGVLDYRDLLVNSLTSNIECTREEVFVLGTVTMNE